MWKYLFLFTFFCYSNSSSAQSVQYKKELKNIVAYIRNNSTDDISMMLDSYKKDMDEIKARDNELKFYRDALIKVFDLEEKLLKNNFDSVHIKEIYKLQAAYKKAYDNIPFDIKQKMDIESKQYINEIDLFINGFTRFSVFATDSIIRKDSISYLQETIKKYYEEHGINLPQKEKDIILKKLEAIRSLIELHEPDIDIKNYLIHFLRWKMDDLHSDRCYGVISYHCLFDTIRMKFDSIPNSLKLRNLSIVYQADRSHLGKVTTWLNSQKENTKLLPCIGTLGLGNKNVAEIKEELKIFNLRNHDEGKELLSKIENTKDTDFRKLLELMNDANHLMKLEYFKYKYAEHLELVTKVNTARFNMQYCLCEKYQEDIQALLDRLDFKPHSAASEIYDDDDYCNKHPRVIYDDAITVEDAKSIYITKGFLRNKEKSFLIVQIDTNTTFGDILNLYDIGVQDEYKEQHKYVIYHRLLFYNYAAFLGDGNHTAEEIGGKLRKIKKNLHLDKKIKKAILEGQKFYVPNFISLNLIYDNEYEEINAPLGVPVYNISELKKETNN